MTVTCRDDDRKRNQDEPSQADECRPEWTLRNYLRCLRREARGRRATTTPPANEEAEHPEPVREAPSPGDRKRGDRPRDARGGIDVDFPRRHAIAEVSRDHGMRPNTELIATDLDIASDGAIQNDVAG